MYRGRENANKLLSEIFAPRIQYVRILKRYLRLEMRTSISNRTALILGVDFLLVVSDRLLHSENITQ